MRGAVKDPVAIQAALSKEFPLAEDKFPTEFFGITPGGRMQVPGSVQMISGGKYSMVRLVAWWPKTWDEFNQVRAQAQTIGQIVWMFFKFEKDH